MSAPEACWRIFSFSLHKEFPAHLRLAVHLPDEETIFFSEDSDLQTIIDEARTDDTTLKQWFKTNRGDPDARAFTYTEFPEHYVWNRSTYEWQRRQRGGNAIMGRMYNVSPRQPERYYLRLLLLRVRGATSYEYLRTVDGILYPTFQSACRALGLLESDAQWNNCLNEAAQYKTPYMLRQLYAIILHFSEPSDPHQLWLNHRDNLSEDYLFRIANEANIPVADLTEEQKIEAYNNCLLDINELLETQGSRLPESEGFTIPERDTRRTANDAFANLTREERLQQQMILDAADISDPSLLPFNANQRNAFTTIMEACYNENRHRSLFFVDGPGGTGKTYLFNALLDAVRKNGDVALATASSGTAALLLKGGRTAHSMFKIPIKLKENSTCSIGHRSALARLIKRTKLIIWDEASMIRSDALKAVDRTFRDLMRIDDPVLDEIPFGGKMIVFGGNFRQVLPVIPRGSKLDIISQCVNQMDLWKEVLRLPLTENMRVNQALTTNDPELARHLQSFTEFLLSIGNGTAPTIMDPVYTRLPDEMILPTNEYSELSRVVYNNFTTPEDSMPSVLAGKAILASTNSNVNEINDQLLESFQGETVTYRSIDTLTNIDDALSFPVEFLNSITTSSLAPHALKLKVGTPIMALRNLSYEDGVSNGTRLICTDLLRNVIKATVITGPNTGKSVFIPRIPMMSDEEQCGVDFKRMQFPIRLAFAMTINKAQGQTLDSVGLYLPAPVFGHGQLYVALSRAKRPEAIKIMLDRQASQYSLYPGIYTANIVYKEVLQ